MDQKIDTLEELKYASQGLGLSAREIIPRADQTEKEAVENKLDTKHLPCVPAGRFQIGSIVKERVTVEESEASFPMDSVEEFFLLRSQGSTPQQAWDNLFLESRKAA